MSAILTPIDHKAARRLEIVKFIRAYLANHGFPPSIREIRDEVGVKSISTVHRDLSELEAARVIRRPGRAARAITLVDENAEAAA